MSWQKVKVLTALGKMQSFLLERAFLHFHVRWRVNAKVGSKGVLCARTLRSSGTNTHTQSHDSCASDLRLGTSIRIYVSSTSFGHP